MPRATACSSSTIRMVAATARCYTGCGNPRRRVVSRRGRRATRGTVGRLPGASPSPAPPASRSPSRTDHTESRGFPTCPPPARRWPPNTARSSARRSPAPPRRPPARRRLRPRRSTPTASRSTPTSSSSSAATPARTRWSTCRSTARRPSPVLVSSVQVHPVNRRPLHVDLFLVRMTEELTVDVPLVATGDRPAVTPPRRHAPAPDRVGPRPRPAGSPAAVDRVLGRVAGRLRRDDPRPRPGHPGAT